jgi:DNA modification methylase
VWWYGVTGADPSASTGHPATFAEAFARDAVDVWSNPGDLVVDPFAGSATVGRACEDLGRRFIGAERVPKYHAIGMQRLAQLGLFGTPRDAPPPSE